MWIATNYRGCNRDEKQGFPKKNKKIQELKEKVKELEFLKGNLKKENEKLKKKNKKLQIQNILTSKQACKWYQLKKACKEKYQKLKVFHTSQANVDTKEVVKGR